MIACPQCDALQEEPALEEGGTAVCWRCGAVLMRKTPHRLDRAVAFAATAAVLLILGNVFPMVTVEAQGNRNATTLLGAVDMLWMNQRGPIAILVMITTLIVPALEIGAVLVLLYWLHLDKIGQLTRLPSYLPQLLRALHWIEPWGMIEVFMLGTLVSIVKLGGMVSVIPGIALWAYGGLIILFASFSSTFNLREIWHMVQRCSDRCATTPPTTP